MFLLQQLRCPARRNFFSPGDVAAAVKKYFSDVRTHEYITRESVKSLVSNGAVPEAVRIRIMKEYGSSPEFFRKKHKLVFRRGDILDSMRMELIAGRKGRGTGR
jgi:hypothetical protein